MEKIGIIRLDKIGDLILTTPAISSLRKIYPDSFIKVYVSLRNREVLEYSPFVDQVEVWDWSLEFIRKVRKEKFDLMIAFSPITESYLAAFLSGSRIRAGYLYSSRPLTRFLSLFWLNKRLVCRIDQKDLEKAPSFVPHEVEQNLELVEQTLELKTSETELSVLIPDREKKWAEAQLPGENWICLHLSRAWIENLPSDFLSDLIRNLSKEKKFFLTYGPDESDLLSKLFLPESIKKFGNLSFHQWGALVSRAVLCLSTNTGTVHLAASQKVPVIAVFETRFFNYHSQRWSPWKVPNAVFRKDDKDLMHKILNEAEALSHAKKNIASNLQL